MGSFWPSAWRQDVQLSSRHELVIGRRSNVDSQRGTRQLESKVNDKRLFASSTARNRAPILDVLRDILPAKGLALEIASGAGEHVVFFAAAFPHVTFCPSDPSAEARESIAAWIAAAGVANVHAPLDLDVERIPWPIGAADAMICINMIHISPWSATETLFEGARRTLPEKSATLFIWSIQAGRGAYRAKQRRVRRQPSRAQRQLGRT